MLGGELGGEPLELGAHVVRLADVACGRPADECTAVRLQLDDPRYLQLAERFADGRPADAELVCERFLAQARADRDRSTENLPLDRRRQPVDEG